MRDYQVVILAGGLGTRLYPLMNHLPKSLIEVAGRPFIFWQMDLLLKNNIKEIVLCIGYKGDMIRTIVGSQYKGMIILYSEEPSDHLLGTAGALKNAEPLLSPAFGILYGDSYLEMDYLDAFKAHYESPYQATMSVWENRGKHDVSNVDLSDDKKRVTCYEKTNDKSRFRYIDYGFLIFNKEIISNGLKQGMSYDLSNLQKILSIQNKIGAFIVNKRFYEIGSVSGLMELDSYLRSQIKKEF